MKLSSRLLATVSPISGIAGAVSSSMQKSGCSQRTSLYASGKEFQDYARTVLEIAGRSQDQSKARRPRAGKSPKSLPDTNSTEN